MIRQKETLLRRSYKDKPYQTSQQLQTSQELYRSLSFPTKVHLFMWPTPSITQEYKERSEATPGNGDDRYILSKQNGNAWLGKHPGRISTLPWPRRGREWEQAVGGESRQGCGTMLCRALPLGVDPGQAGSGHCTGQGSRTGCSRRQETARELGQPPLPLLVTCPVTFPTPAPTTQACEHHQLLPHTELSFFQPVWAHKNSFLFSVLIWLPGK